MGKFTLKNIIFIIIVSAMLTCNTKSNNTQKNIKEYIFLSHIYDWRHYDAGNRVDSRIEKLDLSKYDHIWLGGDICSETTLDHKTLAYLDSLFDLGSPNTHWALGNHDVRNRNLQYITGYTHHKTFYTHHTNGITLVILNTNFNHPQSNNTKDECDKIDEQYNLIKSITDTINHSSHLIFLLHHSIWSNIDSSIKAWDFNGSYPDWIISCKQKSNFKKVVYPLLKKVRKRGVQVILITGDLGARSKKFQFKSKEGIYFLGSGINNSCQKEWAPAFVKDFSPDKILILKHNINKRTLSWDFYDLDSLILSQ